MELKKKNYLALLLNSTQQANFETFQLDSLPKLDLKLSPWKLILCDPIDLVGLKAN